MVFGRWPSTKGVDQPENRRGRSRIRPASVYRDGASEYCQDRDDGPGNGIIDSRGGG